MNLVSLKKLGDVRGALIAVEQNSDIDFDIKRVYYMYNTEPGVRRGFHAHKKLRQLAIPVSGKCTFLLDDGHTKESITLDNPELGLLIEPMVWHEMYDYSKDCVLVVLASDHYDEDDYIRDYETFKRLILK